MRFRYECFLPCKLFLSDSAHLMGRKCLFCIYFLLHHTHNRIHFIKRAWGNFHNKTESCSTIISVYASSPSSKFGSRGVHARAWGWQIRQPGRQIVCGVHWRRRRRLSDGRGSWAVECRRRGRGRCGAIVRGMLDGLRVLRRLRAIRRARRRSVLRGRRTVRGGLWCGWRVLHRSLRLRHVCGLCAVRSAHGRAGNRLRIAGSSGLGTLLRGVLHRLRRVWGELS